MKTQSVKNAPVRDIMTPDPIAVEPTTDARELARVLADNEISGVPVIDAQDRVIGVVSKSDLLSWCVSGGLGLGDADFLANLAEQRESQDIVPADLGIVEDFMSSAPVTVTPGTPILSVARRMVEERIHRIIIVDDDGCLLGIVTSLDLLKALAS